jgi:hypothetical protein
MTQQFSGIWRSHYTYKSSTRNGEFETTHYLRAQFTDGQLVLESESVKDVQQTYMIVRLTLNDNGRVATGTWQETTEQEGYYHGRMYYGAMQLVMNEDSKSMKGKWVGFGEDMEVNTGPWELEYVGEEVPAEAKTEAKPADA